MIIISLLLFQVKVELSNGNCADTELGSSLTTGSTTTTTTITTTTTTTSSTTTTTGAPSVSSPQSNQGDYI